jgi:hypothetical protein
MVKNPISNVICRLAESEDDKSAALSFIEKWFWQHHRWVTPPSVGDILIACDKGDIVGAVNLDFRDAHTPFPLEEIYDSKDIATYFPFFSRSTFVQGGRWSASRPFVSRMLLTAIAIHCTPRGILYMIVEAKHYSVERLEKLGIKFVVLYGVFPDFKLLSEHRQKYYTDQPSPHLVVIKIENLF